MLVIEKHNQFWLKLAKHRDYFCVWTKLNKKNWLGLHLKEPAGICGL